MAERYNVLTSDTVTVFITTSKEEKFIPVEKRFSKAITIKELKEKLEMMTAASPATMTLKIYEKYNNDVLICTLDDDNALLGSYPVDDQMRIHVEDSFVLKKALEDESNAEKYMMSPDEYSKRDDTLKAFLEKNKLGKYNQEEMAKREAERKLEEEAEEAAANSISVGNRCEVSVPGQPKRRAEVMFVGKTQFKSGWWVGVKYDEPMGKNDGSVSGVRYFECAPKYGGFVKPMYIKVGDFPEEDFGLDDEL